MLWRSQGATLSGWVRVDRDFGPSTGSMVVFKLIVPPLLHVTVEIVRGTGDKHEQLSICIQHGQRQPSQKCDRWEPGQRKWVHISAIIKLHKSERSRKEVAWDESVEIWLGGNRFGPALRELSSKECREPPRASMQPLRLQSSLREVQSNSKSRNGWEIIAANPDSAVQVRHLVMFARAMAVEDLGAVALLGVCDHKYELTWLSDTKHDPHWARPALHSARTEL